MNGINNLDPSHENGEKYRAVTIPGGKCRLWATIAK
ncbi:hypothetical protein Bresa_01065|uniref:Uncharacterized protein n=1 Tax=Brenneria salicis ATCC 15712 = DSM 30166 TaxID=714314 RepID=A0A366I0L8_9GAMM|nr:hypothetical protein [Brenneria salicis ATCC 15712 = DSM 30166]RBP60516.1 hypothetical protein DES54_12915 [Brenneria salicis ATCC 15712 = DSM 30166]